VTCTAAVKDPATGEILEVHCNYDPATRGGSSPDGRKVRGTIHWVSAAHALSAEARLYDRLFTESDPQRIDESSDPREFYNPESLIVLRECRVEPSLAEAGPENRIQFERIGYFCVDPDSRPGSLVFNRTVSLRDSWAKRKQ
jgi:glutaminyl-tRNA synthetase